MKKLFVLGFFIAFISAIPIVNAQEVNISNIPQALADALGISVFAGQIMASSIILGLFLLPTMLLMNKRNNQYMGVVIMGLISLTLCVAIGWLPIFVLLVICLFTAGILGTKLRDVFT